MMSLSRHRHSTQFFILSFAPGAVPSVAVPAYCLTIPDFFELAAIAASLLFLAVFIAGTQSSNGSFL